MKSLMKKLVLGSALIVCFGACKKVDFKEAAVSESLKLAEPIDPAPTPDLAPLLKSGSCLRSENILSCLSCDYEVAAPQPKLLGKAEKLAKIMAMSCPVPNKSYAKNYSAPEPLEIQKRLYACTEEIYPETPTGAAQSETLVNLLNETDSKLRQKMFSGLWYRPPYSDHFELYFGLSVAEAVYKFCMGEPGLANELSTTEMANARAHDNEDGWLRNRQAQERYLDVQTIRRQLISCLNHAAPPPVVIAAPTAPAKKCDYQSFEGDYLKGGNMKILSLLASGYKIAVETSKSCNLIASAPGMSEFSGHVKIAGYRCND